MEKATVVTLLISRTELRASMRVMPLETALLAMVGGAAPTGEIRDFGRRMVHSGHDTSRNTCLYSVDWR